jgi:hypothetical protein
MTTSIDKRALAWLTAQVTTVLDKLAARWHRLDKQQK